MSKGWLKASHREKDAARSTPQRPFYTHTNPQPLTPGEIYEFDIEVLPIAYVFKKGHRIRLELANGNSPATDGVFSHPYHPSLMGTDTIHHDARARLGAHPAGDRGRVTSQEAISAASGLARQRRAFRPRGRTSAR